MAEVQALAQDLEQVSCELCGSSESKVLFEVADKYRTSDIRFPVVRCLGCGLVYINPRPTGEAIGSFYPDEYFATEVFHSGEVFSELERVEKRRLSDVSRLGSGGRLLDVGCGNGRFLSYAKSAGWDTLGIEISHSAAEFARTHYGLEIIETDLSSASLPESSFDVVTAWGLVEHVHHPKALLSEIARALKPGGLFAALVPNVSSAQFRMFGPAWDLLDVPRHLYQFSDETLGRMAREAGFEPVWTRYRAPEHDTGNFITSLESIVYPQSRYGQRHEGVNGKRWTAGRVMMGVLRRAAPWLGSAMAAWHGSAAIEMYFVMPGQE